MSARRGALVAADLLDLLGDVRERIHDGREGPLPAVPETDPVGDDASAVRGARGCSPRSPAAECRFAARAFFDLDAALDDAGLRPVRISTGGSR